MDWNVGVVHGLECRYCSWIGIGNVSTEAGKLRNAVRIFDFSFEIVQNRLTKKTHKHSQQEKQKQTMVSEKQFPNLYSQPPSQLQGCVDELDDFDEFQPVEFFPEFQPV